MRALVRSRDARAERLARLGAELAVADMMDGAGVHDPHVALNPASSAVATRA